MTVSLLLWKRKKLRSWTIVSFLYLINWIFGILCRESKCGRNTCASWGRLIRFPFAFSEPSDLLGNLAGFTVRVSYGA